MDANGQMETIAQLLVTLSPEAVEQLLIAFDALVDVAGADARPGASQLLRAKAELCSDDNRKRRLLEAAESVLACRPCVRPWKDVLAEQAAAPTVPLGDWPVPKEDEDEVELVEEELEEELEEETADELPELPRLRVRNFFRGLTVRVREDFHRSDGQPVPAGLILRHLTKAPRAANPELTLSFRNLTIHLSHENHGPLLENAGNRWFQPVPTIECLRNLYRVAEKRLGEVDDYPPEICQEVTSCGIWLRNSRDRGPIPKCANSPLTARLLKQHADLSEWVPILFSGVKCVVDSA